MHLSKLIGVSSVIALSSSMAFAWSISGTVQSAGSGRALAGVTINSFNYAGIAATSAEDGSFSINSDEMGGLFGIAGAKMSANIRGGIFSLDGVNAHQLKISAINALGKVTFQRSFYEISGSVSIDLSKAVGQSASFLRVTADGSSQTYIVKGKNALLKEGDPLPFLQFALDGYQNTTYQATAEVETGVIIKMERASANPTSSTTTPPEQSSSSVVTPPQSSADVVASSASEEPIKVDCSGKTAKVGDKQNMSVTVDGKQRTFIMHIPSAYTGDKPVPLVIDYHPISGSGNGEYGSSPYKAKTDPEGVITLYPDGTSKPGGMGNGWNVGPCCSNDDDVKFSYAMIDKLKEIACIDPQRIYATGFSMGGGMSNHVACMMSDVFAAVAPAAMDLNKTNSAACKMSRPISVINFRGTNDPVCKYQGGDSGFNDGLNFLGAEGTFRFWAEKNECQGSPTKNSNGCDEYSNCKDGTKVVLCTKQNGGHDYGDASIGWPFLKQFTLPASFVK